MKKSLVLLTSLLMMFVLSNVWSNGQADKAGEDKAMTVGILKPADWTEADATQDFVYHVSAAISTLDTWNGTGNDTLAIAANLVFDPLFVIDEEGRIQPWLAKSAVFSEDGMEVSITLRDDVYFTNGEKLTADDLVWRFEDLRDNEMYTARSVKPWRPYLGDVTKTGDYEFTISFVKPMPTFWLRATDPRLNVISHKAVEQMGYDKFWQNPVGTGPYTVSKFDKANSIADFALRSDDHGYWAYDVEDTWTNVKTIKLQYSPEGQTRLSALRAGEVQMIDTIPTTDKAMLEQSGFDVEIMNPNNVVFLQTTSGPGRIFSDAKLREALSLCIDRGLIVDALLSGYGAPSNWACRPNDLGYYNETTKSYQYGYDVEKAKQLVNSSSYKGQPIDFIYTGTTVNIGAELSQAIQSMAAEVGLNLRIRPLEVAMYDEARDKMDYDLSIGAISDDGNMWWKVGAEVIGNDRFNTGYQNETLKSKAKLIQTTVEQDALDKAFSDVYKLEMTEFAPNIYLYWPSIISAWVPGISGIKYHLEQFPDLRAIVVP